MFDVEAFVKEISAPENAPKTTREERLETCGMIIRRWSPHTGQLQHITTRCKLPECPKCHEYFLRVRRKDLLKAQEDFGGLQITKITSDIDSKVFLQKLSYKGVEDYLRIPQEDGSEYIVTPDNIDLDGFYSFDSENLTTEVMEILAFATPGKRRSGSLVDYCKKQERPIESDITVTRRSISISPNAPETMVLLAEYNAISETSNFDVEVTGDNIHEHLTARQQAYFNWLDKYNVEYEIFSVDIVTVDPEAINWFKLREITSIITPDYVPYPLNSKLRELIKQKEMGWLP